MIFIITASAAVLIRDEEVSTPKTSSRSVRTCLNVRTVLFVRNVFSIERRRVTDRKRHRRQTDRRDRRDGRTDDAEVDRRTCGRSLLSTCEEERGESGLLNGVVAGERDAQRVALGRDRLRRLRPAVGAVQARLLLVEPRPNLHRIVLAVLLHKHTHTQGRLRHINDGANAP